MPGRDRQRSCGIGPSSRIAQTCEPEPPPARKRREHQPIPALPDRLLSYALRAVFVLFALVALVTLLESR